MAGKGFFGRFFGGDSGPSEADKNFKDPTKPPEGEVPQKPIVEVFDPFLKEYERLQESGELDHLRQLKKDKTPVVVTRSSGELQNCLIEEISGDSEHVTVRVTWGHPTKPGESKTKIVNADEFLKLNSKQ